MLRIKQSNIIAIATFLVALLLISRAQASPLDITSATELSESTTTTATTETPSTTSASSVCPIGGACGWGVYGENKKKIKYFIRNTCRCAEPQIGCFLDDDDLSLSAFIYRCKDRKTVASTT